MKKVALIEVTNIIYDSYAVTDEVINAISEWQEVSDEDYKLLKDYVNRTNKFEIVVFVENQKETIEFSVKSQLEHIRKEKEVEDKAKAEKERKKLEAKFRRDLKLKAEREKLFKELQQEFEQES